MCFGIWSILLQVNCWTLFFLIMCRHWEHQAGPLVKLHVLWRSPTLSGMEDDCLHIFIFSTEECDELLTFLIAVGTGGFYESYKPDKPWTLLHWVDFRWVSWGLFFFFFILEDQKDVPHGFFLISALMQYLLQCCFLLESCIWILSQPFSQLFRYSADDLKDTDFAFFPPFKWKHSSTFLLSWLDTALVGFMRHPKCFVSW